MTPDMLQSLFMMYFSSVPRCTVFGEAYESRAAHGNKKAAEQATEGV